MSSDPSSSQQLIIGLRTIQIANNIQISTTALFFYDIIITFDQEIRVVWTRKITAASVIYILSRYLMFLYLILTFVENAFDCESSYIVIQFYNSIQCILYAVWAAFTALRTYAISLHAWHVAALVFLLGMVPAGVNSYYYSQMQIYNLPPPTGCILASTIPNDIMNKLVIGTRVCVVAADGVLLLVTWYRTYGLRKAANEVHVRASLASMLLRDGTIYFGVLFLLSLADIILSVTDTFSDTTTFIAILTPMLLARFFLNLRQIDNSGHGTGMSSQGESYQASNLRFAASIFGNMGQSLGIGGEETDGDLDLELTTYGSSEEDPDTLMTQA